MQTAMQPLAAGLITPKPHGLSFTSTPRRRRGGSSNTRRTASKVSCSSIRIAEANGDTVVTIDRPELASRKAVRHEDEATGKKTITMKATVKVHLKDKMPSSSTYSDYFTNEWLFLELVSSELDPAKHERAPVPSFVNAKYKGIQRKDGKDDKDDKEFFIYEATFNGVPKSFGTVGAVLVENRHDHDMFINDITVSRDDGGGHVCFHCNSWVVYNEHNLKDKRIFFPPKSYLPSQTPEGLEQRRKSELAAIRGDASIPVQRKKTDRIYDYDVYNDLSNLDKGLKRPVLGGSERPYPRRCRTGRLVIDKLYEDTRHNGDIYVPRDERFSEHKQHAFDKKMKSSFSHQGFKGALQDKLPEIFEWIGLINKENSFTSLDAINDLYKEGFKNLPERSKEGEESWWLWDLFKQFGGEVSRGFKFETPEIYEMNNHMLWCSDVEFARETLAGMNPMSIQLVKELPIVSQLDDKEYAPKESLITKELIEKQINGAMTADEAVEKKRLFMLDYHDLLLPYVHKVRALKNTTLYGSRTLFFLTDAGMLNPIAIELTRPMNNKTGKAQPCWRQVFTPGSDGGGSGPWLWQLAKTHVLAHDTGYHQLVNHWLRTHCCVEPYIIAANRQLSQMHPIYRLLHPHFRYTMEINAFARQMLINAGGIIESTFSTKEYSMEISSAVYDKFWRFDMEALPNDLIRRGMAFREPDGKLKLTIEDYPYANDGLLVWEAIENWVSDYVGHYYKPAAGYVDDEEKLKLQEATNIKNDEELQEWWKEVRTRGHEDKEDEPWWPELDSHESLVQVLATIIWVTSAHHAAVNFGQYPFGGHIPNRPTIARKNMPSEKDSDMDLFQTKKGEPDKWMLDTLPSEYQSIVVMGTLDLLSYHSPEEEYMGTHIEPAWKDDDYIQKEAFKKFQDKLCEIRKTIEKWNKEPTRHNRCGAGVVPYTLLSPCDGDPFDNERSHMEMGIPNSISI